MNIDAFDKVFGEDLRYSLLTTLCVMDRMDRDVTFGVALLRAAIASAVFGILLTVLFIALVRWSDGSSTSAASAIFSLGFAIGYLSIVLFRSTIINCWVSGSGSADGSTDFWESPSAAARKLYGICYSRGAFSVNLARPAWKLRSSTRTRVHAGSLADSIALFDNTPDIELVPIAVRAAATYGDNVCM